MLQINETWLFIYNHLNIYFFILTSYEHLQKFLTATDNYSYPTDLLCESYVT